MTAILLLFGILIGAILIFIVPIFLIAYLASQSRKKKQRKIIETLPPDIDFYAAMRINSSKQNDAVLKLKAFECSGILYLWKNKAYFKGSNPGYELLEFDLTQVKIYWIGVQAQNGALQWFSIKTAQEAYYFNLDTGMTIFNLSKSGETTQGIYNKLMNAQSVLNIGQIGQS